MPYNGAQTAEEAKQPSTIRLAACVSNSIAAEFKYRELFHNPSNVLQLFKTAKSLFVFTISILLNIQLQKLVEKQASRLVEELLIERISDIA